MLIIRKEQIEVFEKASAPHFAIRAAKQLTEKFPVECDALGKDKLKTVVQRGIERAAAHGFETQNGASLFLDCLFGFGWGFDTDPQLPWAAAVLADEELKDEKSKAAKLAAEAGAYRDQVFGPEGQLRLEAGKRFAAEPVEGFPTGVWFESALRERLQKVWPEKYITLDEQVVEKLIQLSASVASAHQLPPGSGGFAAAGLMFLLGSGFADDPIQARAAGLLRSKDEKDPDGRARKLVAAAAPSQP